MHASACFWGANGRESVRGEPSTAAWQFLRDDVPTMAALRAPSPAPEEKDLVLARAASGGPSNVSPLTGLPCVCTACALVQLAELE